MENGEEMSKMGHDFFGTGTPKHAMWNQQMCCYDKAQNIKIKTMAEGEKTVKQTPNLKEDIVLKIYSKLKKKKKKSLFKHLNVTRSIFSKNSSFNAILNRYSFTKTMKSARDDENVQYFMLSGKPRTAR